VPPERWQQIEELYHAALEREPESRAAFLDEACAGDEELRREVASLLAYDDKPASFIEAPVLEVAARELVSLSGAQTQPMAPAQIGAYQILSPLGRGGMGEVHLALDTRLGRKVAVKLLPARFTTDADRVRRFAQEARAASALNHPNIITIHDIGEVSSTHYIVEEYVEGETLRQRMTSAPQQRIEQPAAIDIALQIAAALAAAHEVGIMHRDIKPENVMVRRDGIVKVLDFGLAKLTEPSAPVVDTQAPTLAGGGTESGVVMGTPRYMSPEQARGEKVDARTDIFSLGVMLYEMIAGRAPFAGVTTSEIIAAILRDEQQPLAEAPPELERIVSRALRKDRTERYQTAKALLDDLNQLKERLLVEKLVVPPSGVSLRNRMLPPEGGTTNKRRRAAIFTLAGLIIAAIAAWFYFNRAPVLTEKDTILLADFENKTGEEIFDKMLKQALAIQLQQTPFLNLFPEARMRHELTLMKRSPNERVTAEIAREICERQNLKALIAGSLAPLGSHYVITLEAINGQSGETLAREQVEAENEERVLRALSQAATGLREKLGESLSSIRRFDKPLEEATTSRLEAFKFYSQGSEQAISGRLMAAIPFLKRAVEIDPEFAYAYTLLSVMHGRTDRPGLAAAYAEKGYALRDKVSEYEKLRIANWYHDFVTGDVNKRVEALMLQKQMYTREWSGPNDLSLTYNLIGQSDQAIAEASESIRLNPLFAAPHKNLVQALLRLNRFAEAREVLARALQQKLEMTDFHSYLYQLAFIDSDTIGMQRQLDWARGKPEEHFALDWQTGATAFAGQWRKTQDFSWRAIGMTERGDTQEIAARYATEQALRGAVFGDCRQARADAAQGLKLERGRVSLPRAVLALALCGETNQVKALTDELAKRYPEDTVVNSIWLPAIRAALELQRGNAAQAIDQLQAASRYEAAAEFWPQHLRGQAYLKLGRGAEAEAEFQKILDHRGYAPLSPLYPLAHLGLARAAALTGDRAKGQMAWDDFFAAWKEADADLPILSEAKRGREKR
jgi:serine/threonine protein kinase/Flp pilus assembly protein TadD